MKSFKEFIFERRVNTKEEILFHISKAKHARSILKQGLVPNKDENWGKTDEYDYYKSYEGVYLSRNLRQILDDVPRWLEENDLLLIVVKSRGFTQKYTDEDAITQYTHTLHSDKQHEFLAGYLRGAVGVIDAMKRRGEGMLKDMQKDFQFDPNQWKRLQEIISNNLPIIFFGNMERRVGRELLKQFKEREGIDNTYNEFRRVIDSITKLKLVHKKKEPSKRIQKPIGFSGNPKIVGIFKMKIDDDEEPTIIYDRMDDRVKRNVLNTLEEVFLHY